MTAQVGCITLKPNFLHKKFYSNFNNFMFFVKGTVLQLEKAMINDHLRVSKYPESFSFKLFIILLFS